VSGFFTDGSAYERLMGRWSRLAGSAFIDWLALPAGLRWLDVGCGNGAFTEELIAKAAPAAVSAIDPSAGQLDFARTRAGVALAEFRQGDAQALPFGDDQFDVAVMALVIAFLPDPAKAVAEMARVVRPGGWIATYMWDGAGGGSPLAPLTAAARSLGMVSPGAPSPEASGLDAMRGYWTGAGLDAITTTVLRIPVVHDSFDAFWEANSLPVGPGGQMIERLSQADRERLRERLREHLTIGADGRIAYEARANAVKGRVPA